MHTNSTHHSLIPGLTPNGDAANWPAPPQQVFQRPPEQKLVQIMTKYMDGYIDSNGNFVDFAESKDEDEMIKKIASKVKDFSDEELEE